MTDGTSASWEGFELEYDEPIRAYAIIRIELVLVALIASIPLDFKHDDRLSWLLGGIFLPVAVANFVVARRRPRTALNRVVALGDLVALTTLLALVPTTWAAIHFCALILVMAFPLVRGDREGLAFAVVAVALIVPVTLLVDVPPAHDRLLFYEAVFVVAAITGAAFMGRVATAEQVARVRARELTRRMIEASNTARHDVAQSLHDGPVQELVGVALQIDGAVNALDREDGARARKLLVHAREAVERNVDALRSELIGLGPVAFDELTFEAAIEECAPTWSSRYSIDIRLAIERLDLPNEVCGALFGIAQEAIANAGRHADADYVKVHLAQADGTVVLRVTDDGRGFGGISPLGPRQPGHLGLASMRERAAIVGGKLIIESGAGGTEVRVQLPADRPGPA